ncbi:MAG TPA: hypothetical protein VFE78_13550 [Gemmataceae bacterium]|jgi:hypothetical protein|nr:hypothetical protein [Gemmataceae bacterium]
MLSRSGALSWLVVLATGLAGCAPKPAATPPPGGSAEDEAALRAVFAELQQALKGRDGEKLWGLLADKAQGEAETAGLTGAGLLDHKDFQRKYGEVPDSKLETVAVHGEDATLRYLEPDGDQEKLTAVHQGASWKLLLKIPKAARP